MNEHIRRANEAMARCDRDEAFREYYEAFHDDDADETDRRIARHRLFELTPDRVFASSSSYLYHRLECPAKKKIWRSHLMIFTDWKEAESAGYQGCPICNPPRPGSVAVR
jgi:methylphosphotriester-DNA--protein-cysteine methyltransferase